MRSMSDSPFADTSPSTGPPRSDSGGAVRPIGVSAHAAFSRLAPRPSAWRHHLPAFMLAGTLLLTAVASAYVRDAARRAEDAQFRSAVESARDRVASR